MKPISRVTDILGSQFSGTIYLKLYVLTDRFTSLVGQRKLRGRLPDSIEE
jgi:hypothetical protein